MNEELKGLLEPLPEYQEKELDAVLDVNDID